MRQELLPILPGELTGDAIAGPERLLAAYAWIMDFKAAAKEADAMYQRAAVEYLKSLPADKREVQIDDDRKLILAKKKTDRYDTAAVYLAIGITQAQAEYLPANPAFRKTAILANPATAGAWSQNIEDKVEVKELNKKFIKNKQEVVQ